MGRFLYFPIKCFDTIVGIFTYDTYIHIYPRYRTGNGPMNAVVEYMYRYKFFDGRAFSMWTSRCRYEPSYYYASNYINKNDDKLQVRGLTAWLSFSRYI